MKHLQEYREKAGLSTMELGAKVGLDNSTIHRYENGKRVVSLPDALRIAKALKTTPAKLWGELEPKKGK